MMLATCRMVQAFVPPMVACAGNSALVAGVAGARRWRRSSEVCSSGDDNFEEFDNWARTTMDLEILPQLEVRVINGIRGVATKSLVPVGSTLAAVPWEACIAVVAGNDEDAQPCPIAADWIDAQYWYGAPWYVKMATWLLYERAQGGGSAYAPYMRQLPWDECAEMPVEWSQEDILELQYPPVWSSIFELSNHLELQHAAFRKANEGKAGAATDLASFRAAVALAFSRCFQLTAKDGKLRHVMAPWGDMFNHKSHSYSEFRPLLTGVGIELRTYTEHQPDREVFISYGFKSNDRLLEIYGFVEANNPLEDFVIEDLLEIFKEEAEEEAQQQAIGGAAPLLGLDIEGSAGEALRHVASQGAARDVLLRRLGLRPYLRQVALHHQGRVLPEVLTALRVLMATRDELAAVSPDLAAALDEASSAAAAANNDDNDDDLELIDGALALRRAFAAPAAAAAALEARTRMCLLVACRLALARACDGATGLAEDQALLRAEEAKARFAGAEATPEQRHRQRLITALKFRIEKKALLSGAQQYLSALTKAQLENPTAMVFDGPKVRG
eukprot:TRINITY_DN10938_c0_g1_i4.p1 TRINITY_DN10938_c0_g1~~TRINITY_DN10938_c0_g1_i4.p1  ORF type:complete len:607 (-),score=223.87 TRINITY_DN10938_c0_g1_i4:164-1837(-)